MAKGIIYITTTSVTGLIKIGKTGTDQFENRMAQLEQNGYWNVSGLHRFFAVEVEDYDDKEKLIHTMFSKSQVANSELFALDKKLAQSLLESFGGRQVYPKPEPKPTSETKAVKATPTTVSLPKDTDLIPDGIYHFRRKVKAWGNKEVIATMRVTGHKLFVMKGSTICPAYSKSPNKSAVRLRQNAKINDDILLEDYEVQSPSAAGLLVLGGSNNGWDEWKTKDGKKIGTFRQKGGK